MGDWFDSPSDIALDITIFVAVLGALTWLIKSKVDRIAHEMFPNSGKSMRDAINRIEANSERIEAKLDNHIEWHLDSKD